MTAPVVLLEHPADGVALIRINRPEARNALNMEVRRVLAQHVADATEDPAVRVIIFTGGEKVFAAGADIKEMAEAGSIEMMPAIPLVSSAAVWNG
ncbi:MAG: enoyl-CoA hydratase-related protein [Chloroflexota bacterium]